MFFPQRVLFPFLIFALLGGITISANAQQKESTAPTPVSAGYAFGSVKASVLADDPRLSVKTVRVVNMRTPIAELLEQFSTQTGITLEARDDQWDDSGRWRVSCCLRDAVTVADAMDALRSALSQAGATWQWKRTGTAPNYSYRFVRPVSIEQLDAANRKAVQDEFRQMFALSKKGLAMTPEQLEQAARTDPTSVLKFMAQQKHTRDGMRAFFSSLSPADQAKVMRGETVNVELSTANEDVRSFAADWLKQMQGWNGGAGVPPSIIKFSGMQIASEHSPTMFIHFDTMGGPAYVGSATNERRWQTKFASDAVIDGDSTAPQNANLLQEKFVPPDVATTITPDLQTVIAQEVILDHELEQCLNRVANAASPRLNFVASLTQKKVFNGSTSQVYGKTVTEFLTEMNENSVATKWRNGILVFRYTAGFANKDSIADVPPYPLYKMLRDRLNTYARNRQIPLSDIVQITALATEAQIDALEKEYGHPFLFLGDPYLPNRHDRHPSYPLFKELSTHPDTVRDLTSEKGVFVGDLTIALHDLLAIPKGTPATDRVTFRQALRDKTNEVFTGYGVFAVFSLIPATDLSKTVELYTFHYPVPQTWASLAILRKKGYFSGGMRSEKPFYSE